MDDITKAWPVVGNSWQSWLVDENVAGYFTAYAVNAGHNFTFATVKGAGHMVPEVQPKSALSLFYRFMAGLPMDYTEPVPIDSRRDGHSAAPPSPFSRCFNSDEEGGGATK